MESTHPLFGIFVLSVIGTWWFFGGDAALWVFAIGCFLGITAGIFRAWEVALAPKRAEKKARRLIEYEVEKHIDTLARKRMMLLQTNDYGVVDSKAWTKEIETFLKSTVLPHFSQAELVLLQGKLSNLATELVEGPACERNTALEEELAYSESMSPTMFEHYCARTLTKSGWICEVTKASADQGVDVVATKGKMKLALQCKKYGSPVGNAAVQEIAAARMHVGANIAAVVSTSGYTRSARELAATTRTLLLHHAELSKIDEMLER